MDCCSICCGDDDRDYWVPDQISAKVGLSDEDLLEFESDAEEWPTDSAGHLHRPRRSQCHQRQTAHSPHLHDTSRTIGHRHVSAAYNEAPLPSGRAARTELSRSRGRAPAELCQQSAQSAVPTRASDALSTPLPAQTPLENKATTARRSNKVDGYTPTKISELTTQEKEEEKKRLQGLVKAFAKEAVAGFGVRLVDCRTGRESDATFVMDRVLTGVELKSKDEAAVPSVSLKMQTINGINKGEAAVSRLPMTSKDFNTDLLLSFEPAEHVPVVLLAESQLQRDKIYTCLKILRLSIDIAKKN